MSRYTWVITRDIEPEMSSNATLRKGPDGTDQYAPLKDIFVSGEQFRMRYALGNQTIFGFILGEFTGFEPLDEYGKTFGCTTIEYHREGKWIQPD